MNQQYPPTKYPNKRYEQPKSLPESVIRQLGYSPSDVYLIRNKYTDTLD